MDTTTLDTTVSNADFLATVATKSDGAALRGDYTHADEQYVVQQHWDSYSNEEHALWRKLYQRQMSLLPGRACDEFIDALLQMNAADGIPEFTKTSEELFKATGWTIVAVPGLIPELTFFEHLANRRFPVTVWLRTPEELITSLNQTSFMTFLDTYRCCLTLFLQTTCSCMAKAG